MLGSKGTLTPMIHGLLRISCSRNPENIRNPPCWGYFLMFYGSQGHAFSCKHEMHNLLTLVSSYIKTDKTESAVTGLLKPSGVLYLPAGDVRYGYWNCLLCQLCMQNVSIIIPTLALPKSGSEGRSSITSSQPEYELPVMYQV